MRKFSTERIILTVALFGAFILLSCAKSKTSRSKTSYESFYDEKYFSWQLQHHKYSARSIRNNPSGPSLNGKLSANSTVVDFGCSAGMVLDALLGSTKICVELNNHARNYACKTHPQLTCYQYPEQLPNGTVDVVHTNAVLEHCETPIKELRYLWRALKAGGVIIVVLSNDGRSKTQKWGNPDLNNHLYTWNSLLLGNMLRAACFTEIKVTTDTNAYPPNYMSIRKNYSGEEWAKVIKGEGGRQGQENLYAEARKPLSAVECSG